LNLQHFMKLGSSRSGRSAVEMYPAFSMRRRNLEHRDF